jgi:hypothetical protein
VYESSWRERERERVVFFRPPGVPILDDADDSAK